jgi:hypothetical protein
MINFTDYTSFIQLAVAFNFAFVCFEGFSPAALFKGLFMQVKEGIRHSSEKIQNNCNILSEKSLQSLDLDDEESIDNSIRKKMKNDTASLIVKINMAIRKVDDRIDMHPVYFNKVCLVLGLYSVLLLLIIGDYKVHPLTNQVWPLFVLGIICYIFYLLIKEVLIFANLMAKPLKNNNLHTVFVTISLFAGSYLAAFFWNSILNQYILLLIKFDTYKIKYISLFLPYISFVICFVLYFCSILYAEFKIYTINILIRKQEKKIEQFLNNNKISGIQFN